jgi:two-component system LytT family response regulator
MLGELERRLDPRQWVRIHRGILVNLGWVAVIEPPAGGGLVVRLKDGRNTALPVARERVRSIKERFVL